MKLIHLSDLHLGKRVGEFPMLEEQRHILAEILRVVDGEGPDAVLIAGDVYDRSTPSAEAVELFDDFLVRLARRGLRVFVVSGNHDSPERIAFGGRIMDASGVHLSPVYNGTVEPVRLEDAHGVAAFYLLPFVKPAHVRRFFPDQTIESCTDALRAAIGGMEVDPTVRNVLIAHQFVTGAACSGSEDLSVGGLDSVDASVFDPFDYVALGHIHGAQNVGSPRVRYCGTPLKYSFSEAGHQKSVTVAELGAKGELSVRTVPLTPRRDMVELRGTYLELTSRSFYEGTTYREDYLHITLTDEDDVPDAVGKLQIVYPYLLKLDYDNARTRHDNEIGGAEDVESRSPLSLFADLYELQNDRPMSEEQEAFMRELIERAWEDEP